MNSFLALTTALLLVCFINGGMSTLEQLTGQVTDLTNSLLTQSSLLIKVQSLESQTFDQTKDLKIQVDTLNSSHLETKAAAVLNYTSLEQRVTSLEDQLVNVLQDVTNNKDAVALLLDEMAQKDEQIEKLQEQTAFHAILTQTPSITQNSRVRFNTAVLNNGNGYNANNGIFTVPTGGDGVYFFSTFLTFRAGTFARMQIRKGNDQICNVWGDNQSNADDHMQGACSGIVALQAGDQVSVTYVDGDTTTPLIGFGQYITAFSGFKL